MILVLCVVSWACLPGCGESAPEPPSYEVPLAPDSPWPKFRRDARQTGLSPIRPNLEGGALWEFQTGKGIFSSPVIGGDGTIYIGSADRIFYALNPDGTERWQVLTGEIIDSAALLDDEGRVFFGSGDGQLYARDAQTGDALWQFQADDPAPNQAFIRWFEGNVAVSPEGYLVVPNDNFYVYALDRDTGDVVWRFRMMDQTWSLPAVDPDTGTLYIGNNNLLSLMGLGDNAYAIDSAGEEVWASMSLGSVAASPLLTRAGRVIVGSFDGFVRAYDQSNGDELWAAPTRDHIYASPALLPDGTIVQPSADGTVYGLDAADGSVRWAFDALEPIRSSPAVDGDGNIYFGSGEGRLFVLNPDGTLRWAMRLIADERNDLNSSPALGRSAIYLAGENGSVFSIPYDYCLRSEATGDERCLVGPGEDLPDEGAFLYYTSRFGAPLPTPATHIAENEIMAFTLFVRDAGDTVLAVIDSESVQVEVEPAAELDVAVSGERRFLTVAPTTGFVPAADGTITLTISGQYLTDPSREGLKMTGGTVAGTFTETYVFELTPPGPAALPLPVPQQPGEPSGVWELHRLAAPLPTILPSYNQIGFDSLHYLVGLVEGDARGGVAWIVGGRLAEDENRTEVDPTSKALFPVRFSYEDGSMTLQSTGGFGLEVMNASLRMDSFRVATHLDETGATDGGTRLLVKTTCGDIPMYGSFVRALGFCNPETDIMTAFGAAELRPYDGGIQQAPTGLGDVTFAASADGVTVALSGSGLEAARRNVAILLVDAATGEPVSLSYGLNLTRTEDGDGFVTQVALSFDGAAVPTQVRAYLMVDAYPAAVDTLDVPTP